MKFEEILHHYQIRSYSEHGVTTQYLGRIVRQFTGKTVYHWICEALVREIAQLLSDTDASLQEISDQLHFSDRPSCPRCSNASRVSLRQSTETRLPEGGPSCPRRTACADPEGRQTPRRFSSFILRNW